MTIANVLSALNAVRLSPHHFSAALDALTALSAVERTDPVAQTIALSAFADAARIPTDFAPAALQARVVALDRWLARNGRHPNLEALMEAAAVCPLVTGSGGVEFDAEIFADLVEFIDELPWPFGVPAGHA